MTRVPALAAVLVASLWPDVHASPGAGDPLPSWNDGASKSAIVSFVRR